MAIARVAGYPDYTNTGSSRYIPIIFSTKTLKRFYERTCLNEIANTDYIGEITAKGDTVVIRTVPDITISDYQKGKALDLEYPESPAIELTIDKAKSFNFAIDDVDEKQFDVKRVGEWADNAAKRMKITIETGVYGDIYASASASNKGATAGVLSGDVNLGVSGTPVQLTKTNILDMIVDCGQVLDEQNMPDENRWILLPAWATAMLKKSDLKDASFTGGESSLLNGRLGMIDNMTIYKTNLLTKVTDGGKSCYNMMFGTKDALCFAFQLTKTEMYRPERGFANAMKGLQVYGYKVVQPKAMGVLYGYK